MVQQRVPAVLGLQPTEPKECPFPVLRETRMPAVVCEMGPAALVVERTPVSGSGARRSA